MACGTPAIAYRCGSVPELIEEGVTGFIVDDSNEAVEAVAKIENLDRLACRRRFEERFSATRMAQDYLKIYARILDPASRADGLQISSGAPIQPNLLS